MIKKVAAVIIKNDCILSVSKKKAPNFYMLPGGKYEGTENDIEALSRELREELNVTISKMEFFGDYEDISMLENEKLFLRTYITEINGEPYPDNEIHNVKWIPIHANCNTEIGSGIAKFVIPKLRVEF
ncbi:NUDIX domain-containing protein [Staphylococcus capitis]|uniref:NUDIX hydrolase n=1 Tax=Staphylococcus capitis TaxID=29388 RepID=UPI0028792807|nr:NUDIX domain-containing protein [Staphylococcus capitis]MDS4024529.1 NUDIX domain-containing protein [Staphylococcus capitis]